MYVGTDSEFSHTVFPFAFFRLILLYVEIYIKYTSHFFTRVCWRNVNSYIVKSLRITAMRVMKIVLCYLHWHVINAFMVWSICIPVMCVISHSVVNGIQNSTNKYIVENICTTAIRVINHSVISGVWKDINWHTAGSFHITVLCVII